MVVASRASKNDRFASPNTLGFDQDAVLNSGDMALSPDALTMLYGQWAVGSMVDQVYVTTRATTADDFLAGTPIAGMAGDVWGFTMSRDRSVVFWSTRPSGSLTIVRAPLLGSSVGTAMAIEGQPPPPANNIHPMLSRDGLVLVFASDAGDGNGYDLYQLTRSCF